MMFIYFVHFVLFKISRIYQYVCANGTGAIQYSSEHLSLVKAVMNLSALFTGSDSK